MKILTNSFLGWLMGLTTVMRYFVIAVMFHVLILFVLGGIKLATYLPPLPGIFRRVEPLPEAEPNPDPNAAAREVEGTGLTSLVGGGTPGHGSGGISTGAGKTPAEYRPRITTVGNTSVDTAMTALIGVVSESPAVMARLQSGGGIVAPPTTGFGEAKIGTPGIPGAGFDHRQDGVRSNLNSTGGGSTESERAVLGAMRWLKEHQAPDGSWGDKKFAEALSALAALCFLGHGEGPDSDEFGLTVSKALGYLVTVVDADGIVKSKNMYAQGAVTLALAEAYGMKQLPQVREPLDRAVNAIVLAQKVKKKAEMFVGGWHYTPTQDDADTSVSGWLIMGLKSARLATITIPDDAFENAAKYLWSMYDPEGGFGYAGPKRTHNMTAVGVLCQQFLGHTDDKRIKKSLDFLKVRKVDWAKADVPGFTLYGWYYTTQAMFQGNGAYWEYWNKEFRDVLIKNQASDGHWDVLGGSNEGNFGPVYSTTLCCLMLEVYYRYLPISQEKEHKPLPKAGAPPPSMTSK